MCKVLGTQQVHMSVQDPGGRRKPLMKSSVGQWAEEGSWAQAGRRVLGGTVGIHGVDPVGGSQ